MSYTVITREYKDTLKSKIKSYIKDELEDFEVTFDRQFIIQVPTSDEYESRVITHIDGEGHLIGKNPYGIERKVSIEDLDVESLSYILDQLLEVNYKILELN